MTRLLMMWSRAGRSAVGVDGGLLEKILIADGTPEEQAKSGAADVGQLKPGGRCRTRGPRRGGTPAVVRRAGGAGLVDVAARPPGAAGGLVLTAGTGSARSRSALTRRAAHLQTILSRLPTTAARLTADAGPAQAPDRGGDAGVPAHPLAGEAHAEERRPVRADPEHRLRGDDVSVASVLARNMIVDVRRRRARANFKAAGAAMITRNTPAASLSDGG